MTPHKLNILLNLVLNRIYSPIFPIIAKIALIIKMASRSVIPNLNSIDVKKQIIGDKYTVWVEFIFIPVK